MKMKKSTNLEHIKVIENICIRITIYKSNQTLASAHFFRWNLLNNKFTS